MRKRIGFAVIGALVGYVVAGPVGGIFQSESWLVPTACTVGGLVLGIMVSALSDVFAESGTS